MTGPRRPRSASAPTSSPGRPTPRQCARDRPGYLLLYSAFNYEYVPLPAVTVGTRHLRLALEPDRRALGTRRMDEPMPSEIRQLMAHVEVNVVVRRNAPAGAARWST